MFVVTLKIDENVIQTSEFTTENKALGFVYAVISYSLHEWDYDSETKIWTCPVYNGCTINLTES